MIFNLSQSRKGDVNMKKNIVLIGLILSLVFCFSVGISANPGTDKIIVDRENNTITFIYDENNEELMEQWVALPRFNDIGVNSGYQMYISHLAQLGIIDSNASNFYPENNITRGDFVEMLALVADVDLATENVNNSDNSQLNAINWAVENNIVSGTVDSFQTNANVTIKEATTMLFALSEYQGTDSLEIFLEDIANAELVNNLDIINSSNINIVTLQNNIISSLKRNPIQITNNLINENATLDPTDTLNRGDAAKLISFYIALSTHPTFIIGSSVLEYIEEDNSSQNVSTDQMVSTDEELFHSNIAELQLTDGELATPQWTSSTNDGTTISVHKELTNQGFYILFNDKSNSITNIQGKYSQNARNQIYAGSVQPDADETDNGSAGHYCSPLLYNKYASDNPTAYTRFNDHYYWAKMYYSWESYLTAYNKLGRAIHYLEDINSPPHSALITGYYHSAYENWVRDNMRADYYTTYASNDTYTFMSTSSFKDISINFATLSKNVANDCIYNYDIPKTRDCLTRSERAVAGLAYRFLIDTGRNN